MPVEGGFFYSIIFVIDSLTQYCSWPQRRLSTRVQRQQAVPAKKLQASHQGGGRHEDSAMSCPQMSLAGEEGAVSHSWSLVLVSCRLGLGLPYPVLRERNEAEG